MCGGSQAGGSPRTFPSHVVVMADNTVKSAQNQFVLKFLASLVSKKLFKSCTLLGLQVGHTHEDIDQLFSVARAFLKRKGSWQCLELVLRELYVPKS